MTTFLENKILQKSEIKDLGQRLLGKQVVASVRLSQGRNSRCYQLQCGDGNKYVLKFYFQSASDSRDRLGVEFKALKFLWDNGVRSIPQAVVMDRTVQAAVYRHVAGTILESGDISVGDINAFVEFLGEINCLRERPEAFEFGPASEACFSIQDIMASVENRLARFDRVVSGNNIHQGLRQFLNLEFAPLWKDVRQWVNEEANQRYVSLKQDISDPERILSASDMGFHNTLRNGQGKIMFFDFEYFGWDDPAKLIVDIILHPAMDLPDDLKAYCAQKLLHLFPNPATLQQRVAMVYPLFGLKWCLILLNEFTREDSMRRYFSSHGEYDSVGIQENQLKKAYKMQEKIRSTYQRFPFLT